MSKDNYILRSLSKLTHKRLEHFVVNRIYHGLNDPQIKFVCQQLVRKEQGYALTDMYFPQFAIHLEVDEPFHKHTIAADELRSRDIIEITQHQIRRIDASGDLDKIAHDVDAFIKEIKALKEDAVAKGEFAPWDYEGDHSPERHIKQGYIDATQDVAFYFQRDALRCFGYTGGHYQRGVWRLNGEISRAVWFPRLWQHGIWKNSISGDGSMIYEDVGDLEITGYRVPENNDFVDERIVFAKWQDPLGRSIYRFTGVFSKCKARSNGESVAFRKVSNRFDLRHLGTDYSA